MSVVQKKWASVYEDCKYLELRGVLRKNFRHKCMRCGLGIMVGLDWIVLCNISVLKFSFAWGQAKVKCGVF